MAVFNLEGGQSITTGVSLQETASRDDYFDEEVDMDIGASLPVLLLPGGQGTQEQQPTRIRTSGLGLTTVRRGVDRSNRARVDGVDEVSSKIRTLYELYRGLSGLYREGSRHYFFILNEPGQSTRQTTAMDTNDSILEQVRSYGTLHERNASFVAQLQEIEEQAASSSSSRSIEKMSRSEVLQGMKNEEIDLNPSAEFAFYQAAASTRTQFMTKFPFRMTYPKDDEKWVLAMGRTPITRIPFIKIALAFFHEITLSSPSISATNLSVEQIGALSRSGASELITEPVKQQVFENVSAVSGVPVRSERPRIAPEEFF